eukprot:1047335-Amorphochlora_amoeboformis.AAC.1
MCWRLLETPEIAGDRFIQYYPVLPGTTQFYGRSFRLSVINTYLLTVSLRMTTKPSSRVMVVLFTLVTDCLTKRDN